MSIINTIVDPGNSFDPCYDTNRISGGRPAGWPPTCFRVEVGATTDGCFRAQDDSVAPETGGLRMEAEIILANATFLVDADSSTFLISKDSSGNYSNALRNWRLYFTRVGVDTNYQFLLVIDEGAEQVAFWYPTTGGLVFGRPYKVRIDYDIQNNRIRWMVDWVMVQDIAMIPGNPRNIAIRIVGSSGSGQGRNYLFYVAKLSWEKIESSSQVPLRPRIFTPGLAR